MIDALLGALAWLYGLSEALGWVVVALFLAGAALERYDREYARTVFVAAWAVFAVFWLSMIYYFSVEQKSIVESVGVVAGVPLSAYIAYLLYGGRDSLFTLSRAVAAMGLVYMPVVTVPVLRQVSIEMVTDQTQFLMALFGYEPPVVSGLTVDGLRIVDKAHPYESTFVYYPGDGGPVTYTIRIACTGLGSMAIVTGLVAAVDAPLRRKAGALAVTLPIIYVLNIVRNAFISVSLGEQYFQVAPDLVVSLFALEDVRMVSYIVSDRIISQSLSVVVLVGILWLVVRRLPEVLTVIDDVLYLVTGREYDTGRALGVTPEP